MTLSEIKKLARSGESETLEFKSTTAQIKKACETLCGFLNHQGGVVLIGANDSGELQGQMVSDNTRQEIAHELSKFEPAVRIEEKYISLGRDRKNRQVISLRAKVGEHKPYVYDGRPYERLGTTTRRMSQVRYDQLITKRAQLNHSWETFEAEKYTLADLNQELILGIVRKAVEIKRLPESALRQDISSVLERLKLLENDHLNNAAVVLFAKELFPRYPQCQLKMARFKGNNRQEFLDSNIVYGNIFDLLEEAMQFVRRHLPVAAKIVDGQVERVETPLIPFKAVREAMINALCHKDYTVYGGSIGLAIYDEYLEIFNNGGLLPGITLSQIKSGLSILRNPKIAEVLYKGDLIEKWGRGIQEIISKCMGAGDPEPEFLVDETEFKIIFRFPKSLKPPVINLDSHFPSRERSELTRRQEQIIQALEKANDLKASEIMDMLQEKTTERTLRKDLTVLKKRGFISSRGHAKTAVWFLVKN
jgi:ATP-dependent DNA helicase RecG